MAVSEAYKWYLKISQLPRLSKSEYREIRQELNEWLNNTTPEEEAEFMEYGVGEALAMLCR